LQGLTIRAALLLGFGVTCGLWLFASLYFTRRMADVERQAVAINDRYLRAQELLSTIRTQVLLGSVYLRDALLDPTPGTAENYRRQMQATYDAADRALSRYRPVVDSPVERTHVAELRRGVDDFQSTLLEVLSTDSRQWNAQARGLLRDRIVPKRQSVIRVSEEVQALNRNAFVEHQAGIARIYADTERQVWWSLGLALAASLGIALFATFYASRLEHQLQYQQQLDLQTAKDLQRLSAKVVSVQEDERRLIARELHDEVGQVLTAIKVELAVAQRRIEDSGGAVDTLRDAVAIADRALHTVRDLSHLLHPALLDDLGLSAAIASYVRGVADRHGLDIELFDDGVDERLAAQTEVAAYRIVQEALTNVVKHAKATRCQVYLQRLPDTLLVTVDDDGQGFDAGAPERRETPGLGLIGIRERVAQLGGTLRIETASGKGMRLTAELPSDPRPLPAGEGLAPLPQSPLPQVAHG
jgi:signal transduction histidine kinase